MNQVVIPIQPTFVAPVVKTPTWGGQGSTDLQRGIETGNVEQVLDAVKVQGISVHDLLPNGELPLCFAAKLDLSDMAQVLMKVGSKPSQKDSHGYTATEHAAFLKCEKVLPCLMSATAKSQVDEVNQEYPKMSGQIKALRKHCERLALLIPVAEKRPALNAMRLAAFNGDLEALRAFDGDVDGPDLNGLTAIHYALLGRGGFAALDILLSKGANPHFVTKTKETYLHFAAVTGKIGCVAKLCEHGLKVTRTNNAKQSPLHYATVNTSNPQYWSMYDALVQRGAKSSAKDMNGLSPLHLIKAHIDARDPTQLRTSDLFLFYSAAGLLGSYLASEMGYLGPQDIGDLSQVCLFGTIGTLLYKTVSEGNFGKYLAGVVFTHLIGKKEISPYLLTAFGCNKAASSASYSWNNLNYQGWNGVKNLTVQGTSIAGSVVASSLMTPMSFSSNFYSAPEKPTPPPPENWQSLSEKERILHEGLDPTNPRHAEKILHCDKAKVDKYPTDAELEVREEARGKIAECKAYNSCVSEAEIRKNEECEERYQPAEMEEDSPAWERETQQLEECLSKPINPSRCKWEQSFWFDPDQCDAHQEAISKVTSAYKSALKGCYRELAMKWHPDKNPDPDAEKVFPRIGEAWETVSS